MTIEIKQLILRAVVEERRARPLDADRPVSLDAAMNREIVIAECTRQVLRELRRGRGR